MKIARLEDMKGGWFIGNFEPSLFKTNDVEVAVKKYKAGDKEGAHYHKIATEYTLIVKGTVKMFNREWNEGDIVVVEPEEATAFEAITDAMNVVVKIPGANNDKFICKEEQKC